MTQVEEAKMLLTQLIEMVKGEQEKNKLLSEENTSLRKEMEEKIDGGNFSHLKLSDSQIQEKYDEEIFSLKESKRMVELSLAQKSREYDELQRAYNTLFQESLSLGSENEEKDEQISSLAKECKEKDMLLSRRENMIQNLQGVREELLSKNSELMEKLSRLSSPMIQNSSKASEGEAPMGPSSSPEVSGGVSNEAVSEAVSETVSRAVPGAINVSAFKKKVVTYPYKFGKTTEYVIGRVREFIDAMYSEAMEVRDESTGERKFLLSNPEKVAQRFSFSEKERKVFMERLQNISYMDSPMFFMDDNGNLSSLYDKEWMKAYVSSRVDKLP